MKQNEPAGRECFWPTGCSDSARCREFGQCVAAWQIANKDKLFEPANPAKLPDYLIDARERYRAATIVDARSTEHDVEKSNALQDAEIGLADAIKRYGDEQYGLGMRHCIELEGPAP